ncbi:hypothetical protein BG011_006003 [Mortierella polycephala]|uniref:Uncharacterized protein n=1 Tax=Mortierella polycephala TaxID=41804 RepID=A0A9P6PWB4_9FUNG|nr:hypothetical protein BG011_006003 [Mortierella polycephala]
MEHATILPVATTATAAFETSTISIQQQQAYSSAYPMAKSPLQGNKRSFTPEFSQHTPSAFMILQVKKYREAAILISQAGQDDDDAGLTLEDRVVQKFNRYYELKECFGTDKSNEVNEMVEAGIIDELQDLVLKEEDDPWKNSEVDVALMDTSREEDDRGARSQDMSWILTRTNAHQKRSRSNGWQERGLDPKEKLLQIIQMTEHQELEEMELRLEQHKADWKWEKERNRSRQAIDQMRACEESRLRILEAELIVQQKKTRRAEIIAQTEEKQLRQLESSLALRILETIKPQNRNQDPEIDS